MSRPANGQVPDRFPNNGNADVSRNLSSVFSTGWCWSATAPSHAFKARRVSRPQHSRTIPRGGDLRLLIAESPPLFLCMKIITRCAKETETTGQTLAAKLRGGDVLCLTGDLGAGKTTLVKGLAKGLGVKKDIKSPTFTLMNLYSGKKLNLVHIDTYRLKDQQELADIGALDYLGAPDAICVVEWPEKIAGLLKNKKTVPVTIEHISENQRKITVDLKGKK